MKISNIASVFFVVFVAISFSNGVEAKKKKKGQNPPKKKEKVPEKPKLRLVHWFGNMSDITYRCPATEYPNYKRIVQIAKEPVTTVVDCSVEGSRWDYDIKVFIHIFLSEIISWHHILILIFIPFHNIIVAREHKSKTTG